MHPEAWQWVERCSRRIGTPIRVLDQGGQNVNGSIRELFPTATDWTAVDLVMGAGVDVVADCGDYVHPECDVVVSTELLEHTPRKRDIIMRAYDSLRDGGYFILTAAGTGRPPHGACGDPLPGADEFYENVNPDDLRVWLEEAGFADFVVDDQTATWPQDVRVLARKTLKMTQDIAVIVPVKGRAANAAPFMESVGDSKVYAICERDEEDVISAWREAGAEVVTTRLTTFAQKVNLGYQVSSEPWMLLVGNDVVFHEGWQDEVLRVAEETGARVIGTNDLLAPETERAVHPVISRAYVDELGASWDGPKIVAHGYKHWFTDNEIHDVAVRRGVWAYAEKAVIEHKHFLNGKAEEDDIYRAGFATAEADQAEYQKRKAEFDIAPLRTCVYGIAKDEAKHVARWATTALAESDYVVLVDTGSTDETVQIARDLGVIVHQISVVPWRFDMARNAALALLPADADVCISLDMDEWLQPGWRKALEREWQRGAGTGKVTLKFVDGEDKDANITLEYLIDRAHHRQGAKWVLPCHEIITNLNPAQTLCPSVVIHHLPDSEKSRADRDMPLLQLGVQENPDDPRSHYYLGRQFFYANDWVKARAILAKYLQMPTAQFDQERSEACRFIARMVFPDQQERWYLRACYEAPQRRETWAELAMWYRQQGRLVEAAGVSASVLRITEKTSMNSFHVEPWAWQDDTFKEIIEESKR